MDHHIEEQQQCPFGCGKAITDLHTHRLKCPKAQVADLRQSMHQEKEESTLLKEQLARIAHVPGEEEKSREGRFAFLQLLEATGRYKEIREGLPGFLETMCKRGETGLTWEEWTLIAASLRAISIQKRNACSSLSVARKNCKTEEDTKSVQKYAAIVRREAEDLCTFVQNLVDERLNKVDPSEQGMVMCERLKADFYRYLGECTEDDARLKELAELSWLHYQKALDTAEAKLNPANPARVILALNYTVLLVEMIKDEKRGVGLGQRELKLARENVEKLPEADRDEAQRAVQMLADYLSPFTRQSEHPGA